METNKSTWSRFAGKGLYPPSLAWVLLLPFRNLYLSPKTLATRLRLQENWEVLELGCGPGYFSPYIASKLPKGKLYLADVQKEMLEKAEKRIQKKGIQNASVLWTDGKVLPFPNAQFDCIYLITVLGEITNPESMLAEMKRVLKAGGILSITEQGGDPDALTLPEVRSMLEPVGFAFQESFGKGRTFTANFKRV